MSTFHTPVLLQEVLEFLDVKRGERYIDATIGGAGHAIEIVKRGGIVLGIDHDEDALGYAAAYWEEEHKKLGIATSHLQLVRGNFREIDSIARSNNFAPVAGVLFDLGVSSRQLEDPQRGFSFAKLGPLDMRMDPSASSGQVTAADLVNAFSEGELYELFFRLGEESRARAISRGIVRARRVKRIETTMELAQLIEHIVRRRGRIHPATRVFQALRIAVNDELRSLSEALPKALSVLSPNGRLVVISFHSLEDRIVKYTFQRFEDEGKGTTLTKKPVLPTSEEVQRNIRSRSAKLRVFERL